MSVPIDAELLKNMQAELQELKARVPLETFFHKLKPGFEPLLQKRLSAERPGTILQMWPLPPSNPAESLARALKISLLWEFSPSSPLDGDCHKIVGHLKNARGLCLFWHEPVLEPWQIYFARHLGMDCISLYPSVLSPSDFLSLVLLCKELGMTAIPNLLSPSCLQQALQSPAPWLCIRGKNPLGPDLKTEEWLELSSEIPQQRQLILPSPVTDAVFKSQISEMSPEITLLPLETARNSQKTSSNQEPNKQL